MLKLKLQYFGHQMEELTYLKRPWCWESLKAGGEGDDRGWDGWMASPIWWTWVWASSEGWWTGKPGVLHSMGSQSWTRLSDWTTTTILLSIPFPMDIYSSRVFYHIGRLYCAVLRMCQETYSERWLLNSCIIIHLVDLTSVNYCSAVWPFSLSLLICKMGIPVAIL